MKSTRGLRGVAVSLLLTSFLATAFAADAPDLTGAIKTASGDPLANARIFIYTAGPKEGAGILCPSCYEDCRKRATSDADGRFKIAELDPTLLFRVLVAAPGYQPAFVPGIDPAKGPIEAKLKPVAASDSPNRQMRGRVVDFSGKPIAGAVVEIRGVSRNESTRFGGNDDVDPLAVTDDDGAFVIHSANAFDSVGVEVSARAFAKAIFQKLETGGKIHDLKLGEGATVKGRIVKDGKPLGAVEVGLSGSDRSAESYVGNTSVATDSDGNFVFSNVTPNRAYQFYGIMNSLREKGSIPAREFKVLDHGSTLDIGEVKVEPAFKVAGLVRAVDNSPLPEKTRVFLGREQAWDSQQVEVDSKGRFEFLGVPAESISVSTRVKNYRLTTRNASLDPLNSTGLIGTIDGNKTNLVLEIERGSRLEEFGGSQMALRKEPLRGAEAAGKSVGGIEVTGAVTDAETGQPLTKFTVTEGRSERPMNSITWMTTRKSEFADGKFTMSFPKSRSDAAEPRALLIEAPDHLPAKIENITGSTNVTVALKNGSDVNGVVLKPDGSPLANAKVYQTDMRDGVYVSDDLKVHDRLYRGTKVATTDSNGAFSFPPQIDAYSFIVIEDAGYAEVMVNDFKPGGKIQLAPYARVEGKLMIGSNPGARETVRLGLAHTPYVNHPRDFPALSLFMTTKTDAEGKFVFERVPPIRVSVSHSPKVRDSSMGTIPEAQVTKIALEGGKTTTLTLGGKGRPVVGRMVVNGYEGKINWRNDVQNLEAKPPQPAEVPDFRAMSKAFSEQMRSAKTDEEKKEMAAAFEKESGKMNERMRDFYRSDAGWEFQKKQTRDAIRFSEDGSFRVEDIRPGKYLMRIDLREPGEGMNRFSAPAIARLEKEIEVPAFDGERTDEPYDLGVIELAAKAVMKGGKLAPEFEARTLDGKRIKLADFRGKYLLLDFWAVWCGPCVAETPHLKNAYEAFKNDPRFAMVGLSLDPEKEAPIEYQKKNDLGWTQGFLGEWSGTDVPNKFGVEGIPSIFLIGPDGKILETGLRGEAIITAVRKALANAK